MRLMAAVAGKPCGMFCRVNLREIHGFGVIRFMTTNAQHCSIELRWHEACRIFRVLRLRAMAGFARNVNMASCFLHIQNLAMAGFAYVVSGVGKRLGFSFLQGVTSIMSVAAKALRHQQASHDQEQQHPNDKNRCKPQKVPRIFESEHTCHGPQATPKTSELSSPRAEVCK